MTTMTKEIAETKERLAKVETKVEDLDKSVDRLHDGMKDMRKEQREQTKLITGLVHERGMDPKRLNDDDEDPEEVAKQLKIEKKKFWTKAYASLGLIMAAATTAIVMFIQMAFPG